MNRFVEKVLEKNWSDFFLDYAIQIDELSPYLLVTDQFTSPLLDNHSGITASGQPFIILVSGAQNVHSAISNSSTQCNLFFPSLEHNSQINLSSPLYPDLKLS